MMLSPRPPMLPPPRPAGPSPAGRVLAIACVLLVIIVLALLYPTFRALNGAIVGAIEDWRPVVGGAALLFLALLGVSIVRMLFAIGFRMSNAAQAAALTKLQNGQPIHVADVPLAFDRHGGRALDAFYAAKLAEAQREMPQLHSFHQSVTHAPAQLSAPAAATVVDAPPLAIPTFAELLDSGQIGLGKPLILGYNAATGQPITGAWKDLYSCGVGALQGAGKSWLLAFLLGQSAAGGGRLIICDLHAGDEESLANRIGALAPAFMCDIASTPKEIEAAFAFADDKLEKRKSTPARWPIVLVADEWTSLLRTSAGSALPAHIQNIAEQGRKFNVNGILAAQAWTKAASSNVRNQLTSHYVMRQRLEEARYQLGLPADQLPDDIRGLPDATGYLLNVRGELIKIVVPFMTAADLARCGELIPNPAGSPPKFGFLAPTQRLPVPAAEPPADGSGTAAGRQRDGSAEVPATAAGSGKTTSPEAARAASLFLDGTAIPEIVEALRGVSSTSGGRAYRAAREEIENLIREGVQR